MINKLENKIKKHAVDIFDGEPLTGHRERFAGKLQAAGEKKQVSIRRIISYVSVAAVFAGAIFFIKDIIQPEMETESLSEVQSYYTMQLQDKIYRIEQLLTNLDEENRNTLIRDMETMQQEAEAYIQDSGENNIPFIVMVYSTKIEALEHIQNLLTQ
ncbi:MAG: hypothetical protein LBE79_05815 [Tannerella sp.]|jgi:hypothetical protein|nr:hypothetical protein [Tannerella sp.]